MWGNNTQDNKKGEEIIKTPNLILKPSDQARDIEPFLNMLRRDGNFQLFTGAKCTEEELKGFSRYFERSYSKKCFSVFEREDPEHFIGYVGVHREFRFAGSKIEIEFYISKDYRNKGYATEAGRALLYQLMEGNLGDHGEKFETGQVFAKTLSRNSASIRVLKKLGFEKINEDYAAFLSEFVDWQDSENCQELVSEYCLDWTLKEKKGRHKMNWNQRGKILFSEAWFKNKEKFRNYLQTHQQEEYAEEYIDLLKALIEVVINPELEEKLRIDYIVEADQDGYQGEKIWLIPYDSFSCPEKYIWTHTYYGSCAGCDTLKGIAHYDYGYPTCEQVEEYLTLALHLLQRMKPFMTREEEEWEERMDKAVDSGQGEKMMQQLRLIASK